MFLGGRDRGPRESSCRPLSKRQIEVVAAVCAHGCVPRGDQRRNVKGPLGQSSGSGPFFQSRPFRQQRRPLHDVILEVGVSDLGFSSLHPPAHGNAGFMHRIRIAGNQRMPPIEITALGDQLVTATGRQPVQGSHVLRREPDTVWNLVGPVRIILAGAQPGIQQSAGNMGEIDLAGILVLELLEATPRAAVAQAFPFGVGHLLQRLGFPKESLLARGRLGSCGHESRRFRIAVGLTSLGALTAQVQVGWPGGEQKAGETLALLFKIVSQTIGL